MPSEIPTSRVSWQFDPHRAALLVHDMQDYFLDFYDHQTAPVPRLFAHVQRLIQLARNTGMPVYYTAQLVQQTPIERGLLTDMWGPGLTAYPGREAIYAAIAPKPGDRVLDKWRYSAFQRSDLEILLNRQGRHQLVICGVYAHIGCLMTASEAFMRDIQPFFVADALADFSEQKHKMALEYVAQCCGKVVLTEELAPSSTSRHRPASMAALCAQVAQSLQIPQADLQPQDNLIDWGLDSIRIMAFVEQWRQAGVNLNFMQLAQEPTLEAWWSLLQDTVPAITA